ncbi:MAG: DUF4330 domain-containing protein [Clostridiales bacterium]|nr:DUF4330 domain-containing protein [Clostridiales bacterium]
MNYRDKILQRINFFDILVLLLIIIAIVLGTKQFAFSSPNDNVDSEEILVKLVVRGVRAATVDVINEGDVVICVNSKEALGTIISKEINIFQTTAYTKDGKAVLASVPNRYDVLISVRGYATITENEIMINSTALRAGTIVRIFTNVYEVKTTVVDIEYNK